MYKFIFELLSESLGLPIPLLYEYIILLLLNGIAFHIAWDASPGGSWGSEIHWLVRVISFFLIWFITYILILLFKWVIANWMLIIGVIIALILLIFLSVLVNKKVFNN